MAKPAPAVTPPPASKRLISVETVIEKTSLSRSSIYREMSAGRFPKGVPLTNKRTAWIESEVDAWVDSMVEKARG